MVPAPVRETLWCIPRPRGCTSYSVPHAGEVGDTGIEPVTFSV